MAKYLILGIACFSSLLHAEELYVQSDRYTEVKIAPKQYQLDLLDLVVDVQFPAQVITVENALHYLLEESGYALIDSKLQSPEMKIMLKNKIPSVHRDLTPMKLSDALSTVFGKHFRLVRDPLRRKVSFILKPEYKGLL